MQQAEFSTCLPPFFAEIGPDKDLTVALEELLLFFIIICPYTCPSQADLTTYLTLCFVLMLARMLLDARRLN
jgi:hypothetical protein